jgi:hypothetical protein
VLTESLSRVHMTVDREYENLLKAIRSAYSHKMPAAADFELLKECMKLALKEDEKRSGIVDKPRADKIGKNGRISQSVKRIVKNRDQASVGGAARTAEFAARTTASNSTTSRIARRAVRARPRT